MLESISFEVTRHPYISLFEKEQAFKTSLDIIGEVMNVPMRALESIDEKMLSIFADA